MSKFEKLLDLLVNEQKDEAEKLFHEIVVEKSRSIYEGILADEEAETTEESAEKDDADEVDEVILQYHLPHRKSHFHWTFFFQN